MQTKTYLGDSVYVDWDDVGKQLVLTTENGDGPASNTIFLEPEILGRLNGYFERIKATQKN